MEPSVLVNWPDDGAIETVETAQETVRVVHRAIRANYTRAALIVLLDPITSMDGASRRVYADGDAGLVNGVALVVSSLLSRAIGSFFMGITKPRTPVTMVASLDEARAWCREMNHATSVPTKG